MSKFYPSCLLILGLWAVSTDCHSQEPVDGSAIFAANCSACHTIGQGQLIGPDLKGLNEKYEKPWIMRFVRESQAMIEEGEEKAVAVFNAYSMMPMPPMPLSDEQMEALLAHISRVGNTIVNLETELEIVENEASTTSSKLEKQLPIEQRDATRKAMMTGFWIALVTISVMGLGIWWATR